MLWTRTGGYKLEKGCNSDVEVAGSSYHIQTEDWGKENPYIVSRVFKNGAVVQSLKTPYSQVISSIFFKPDEIKKAIKKQHELILDQLITGKLR